MGTTSNHGRRHDEFKQQAAQLVVCIHPSKCLLRPSRATWGRCCVAGAFGTWPAPSNSHIRQMTLVLDNVKLHTLDGDRLKT
jgi:hypothetical protein